MVEITMPDILMGFFSTCFVGWVAWVSITMIRTASKVSVMSKENSDFTSDLSSITKQIQTMSTDLTKSFKELKDEVKHDIGGVNKRLDTFLQNEIDELKRIVGQGQ